MPADVDEPASRAGSARPLMRHVPAIDGLRAIAVVGVMLFHGGVSWMPGGFLGVDVFFVLSGYLITTLLLRERASTGRIDLKAFWVRRLRRLAPALLLLLAALGAAAPFVVEASQRASVRGDGLAALAYVANWRFVFTEQSYFGGTPSPLRHLWSLSVEEQWYLVFPVAMALALRSSNRTRLVLVALVAVTAASALWMARLVSGSADVSRAYYGTDARAHSLLVGAVLAVVAARWSLDRARRLLVALGGVGLVLVLASFVLVHEQDRSMYRGGFLLLALASAAVVAAVAVPDTPGRLGRLLGWGPLVAIGKVSYGLYLWHWPVDVVLTPDRTGLDGPGWWVEPALLALRTGVAAAAALASYRWVEDPIRRHGIAGLGIRLPRPLAGRPATAGVMTALVVGVLFAGTLPGASGGGATASGVPPEVAAAPQGVPDDSLPPLVTVPDGAREATMAEALPPVPEDRDVEVLTVGDSIAWTLAYRPDLAQPDGMHVSSASLIGCGVVRAGDPIPVGEAKPHRREQCETWPRFWQQKAEEDPPDVVMVQFGGWEVFPHLVDGERVEAGTEALRQHILDGLDIGLETILAIQPDVRFVVIGMPCMREESLNLGAGSNPRNDDELVGWANGVFAEWAAGLGPRATYVDLGELLCPGGEFREQLDGVEARPDGSHFADGVKPAVWEWLGERIIPFARQPIPAGPAPGADEAAGTTEPPP